MGENRLRTLREGSPEATTTRGSQAVTNAVQAWGPFRDGRFLVNVGHSEYTPEQALRLAIEIVECAMVAAAAQREHDHPVPVLPPQFNQGTPPWAVPDQPAATEQDTASRAAADEAASVAGTMWAAAADHAPAPKLADDSDLPWAGPQPGPQTGA